MALTYQVNVDCEGVVTVRINGADFLTNVDFVIGGEIIAFNHTPSKENENKPWIESRTVKLPPGTHAIRVTDTNANGDTFVVEGDWAGPSSITVPAPCVVVTTSSTAPENTDTVVTVTFVDPTTTASATTAASTTQPVVPKQPDVPGTPATVPGVPTTFATTTTGVDPTLPATGSKTEGAVQLGGGIITGGLALIVLSKYRGRKNK